LEHKYFIYGKSGARSRWNPETETLKKQGVCHAVALPFTLKLSILKAKEELWKLKYFTIAKNIIFKKIL
jgi:hypothetical protein